MAPIERSIPPVRMTSVWPEASSIRFDSCRRMFVQFGIVMKFGLRVVKTTIRRSSAASNPAFVISMFRKLNRNIFPVSVKEISVFLDMPP